MINELELEFVTNPIRAFIGILLEKVSGVKIKN
jgi:hypothetical protein